LFTKTHHFAAHSINGKPVNSASDLLEDYWFGHRIKHGSGDQVNVTITAGYEIKAKNTIEIGEELFMDYNRSIVCEKCEAESDFYDLCFTKPKKCNFCGSVPIVKPILFVFSVMTKSRSHFKKYRLCFIALSRKQ